MAIRRDDSRAAPCGRPASRLDQLVSKLVGAAGLVPQALPSRRAHERIPPDAFGRHGARPLRQREGTIAPLRLRVREHLVALEFKLPDLGEGLTEGEISRWLVSEGQEIAEDDPLVEIQTDKTTVEIPSPAAGKVTSILVEEGKGVPVGTVLVVIGGEPDGDQPLAETAPAADRPARARATPIVRKIA